MLNILYLVIEQGIYSSIYLKIKIKGENNFMTGNGIAVSPTQALCALHGRCDVDDKVNITTRNGINLMGTITFSRYAQDQVDISVITLDNSSIFSHYIPVSQVPVTLGKEMMIISMSITSSGEFAPATDISHVRLIETQGTLFQATYFSSTGMSGAGVVAINTGDRLEVVGVHVASHDNTVAVEPVPKKAKGMSKDKYNRDMMTINSNIHGHGAYSLICEPARIPELLHFLNMN